MSFLVYFVLFFVVIVCIYWFYTNILLRLRSLEKYIENIDTPSVGSKKIIKEPEEKNLEQSDNESIQISEESIFDTDNSKTKSKDSLDGSISIDVSINSSIEDW